MFYISDQIYFTIKVLIFFSKLKLQVDRLQTKGNEASLNGGTILILTKSRIKMSSIFSLNFARK